MIPAVISGPGPLASGAPPLAIGGMRGIQPALDLPLAQHGSLVGLHPLPIALTRSSEGSLFGSAGVLQTSGADSARFDHTFDGTNWVARGLLIEEARTNLSLHSEEFSNDPIWFKSPTLLNEVDSNTDVAPDGTTTMDTLRDLNLASIASFRQDVTVANDSLDHTFSIFILKDNDETRFPRIQLGYQLGTIRAAAYWINTKTGATFLQGAGTVTVEDYGLHWRMSCTLDNNSTGNTKLVLVVEAAAGTVFGTVAAGATGEVIVWGAQLEKASFPTSYIKTTTVAVTRAADVATITDMGWFNPDAGTFYVEASFSYTDANGHDLLDVDDGGITDRFRLRWDAPLNVNFSTKHSADTDGASDGAAVIAAGTTFRVAATYADDDVRAAVDGTLSPADTTAAIPLADAMTTLRIGATVAGGQWDGHIARVTYWPIRLPDLHLQALTS